ncbi:MAG: type II toxin-antitoxin system PemK/MazF family toxin [Candidatus Methanoperedens sp.]|nr:type II toxin-antitoxin system PemK/MazF family toxin [Candidatus Methanoperedens sp.]
MELIRRGDVYWVKLDPIEGSEIGKIRPAVVISNNINNEFADTVTVLPVTSSVGKVYPFEVFLKKGIANISSDSKVKANQIRTVDKKRLKHQIGTIPDSILSEIGKAVKIHLELR